MWFIPVYGVEQLNKTTRQPLAVHTYNNSHISNLGLARGDLGVEKQFFIVY